jgi:succinate dehydrogenase/fumarate reductase flavoprotein subunit
MAVRAVTTRLRGDAASADEVDLLVVGAGAAGMTAALAAALQGCRVMLCEATQQVGGTTATSAGTLWLPGNRQGAGDRAADVAGAARYLDALVGTDDPRGLRRTFLAEGAAVLAEIERRTQLRFVSAGLHPDYLQAPGAAQAGRALSPLEFDGRLLARADFARVRPPMPELLVLGGMMANKADVQALFKRWRSWAGFSRSARLVARYLFDRLRHPRGTRLVLGNALVARLLASLRDAGVDLRFGQRLLQLTQHQGRVTGAVFEHEGLRHTVAARCGVVLATGGIGHDAALRAALTPEAAHQHSLACASVRGEGLAAARAAGARFERFASDFLWQPVSRVPRADGTVGLFPHLYLDRAKPGLIAVDGRGRRFVDEGVSYHHFVEAQRRAQGAGAPAWLVCDSRFVRRYGLGIVPPGGLSSARVADGYLVVAASLAELAARMGVDMRELASTVARHNVAARRGSDPEFHKGESPLSRFNGDAAHGPNPCLGEIATAPFCAVAVWAADAASCSGLATDADAAVLRADGSVIPGLHACGNDMASPFRGAYPGPGATLGPALVFGWRAGVHAVAQARADERPVQDRVAA